MIPIASLEKKTVMASIVMDGGVEKTCCIYVDWSQWSR
jgi:hypothetical protein